MIFVYIKDTEENIIGSNTDLTDLKTEMRKVLFFESPVALYQLVGHRLQHEIERDQPIMC